MGHINKQHMTMNGRNSNDSEEEGEIRDSDDERYLPKPKPAHERRRHGHDPHISFDSSCNSVKPVFRTSPPFRSGRSTRPREFVRRPSVTWRQPPPSQSKIRRKRSSGEISDENEDVDSQIAKTRRRMQQTHSTGRQQHNPAADKTRSLPALPPTLDVQQEDEIQVLEVPPKKIEVVQIDDDETGKPANTEDKDREKELVQLRMLALKSSLEAKWGSKKKRQKSRSEEPYSPTGPLTPGEQVEPSTTPAPSPLPSPVGCDQESDEDEEALRLSLLQQIKKGSEKSSEDKENNSCQIDSTNKEVQTAEPKSKAPNSDTNKPKEIPEAVTEITSSKPNGRFIISLGPDSSDSESESEVEHSRVEENIDLMLKKMRETAEQKKKAATQQKKTAVVKKQKSPARHIPLNHPLSVLPKSKQAEYLRLQAILKKKEELRKKRQLAVKAPQLQSKKAEGELQLPSLNALTQSLPLLSEEERLEKLRVLEADQGKFIGMSKEHEERLASLRSQLDKNLSDQQEAKAIATAASSKRAQYEQEAELLRRQLLEVEAAAAASLKQQQTLTQKLQQLKSEEEVLNESVKEASVEAARLRAACALLRDACAYARGDNEVKVLEEQLSVLSALASNGDTKYRSPLEHLRNISCALDPNREVCPDFMSGHCPYGDNCTLQHP